MTTPDPLPPNPALETPLRGEERPTPEPSAPPTTDDTVPGEGRGKRSRRKTRRSTIIRLGTHVTLTSEDHYLIAFKPLGMTRRGFRRFLEVLQVPFLEVGSTRLVDDLSFQLALRSILRVGERPFLAPGCETLSSVAARDNPAYATTLAHVQVEKHLPALIAELLLTHGLDNRPTSKASKKAAIEATGRLLSAGLATLPTRLQGEVRRRSIENLNRISLEMGLDPSTLTLPAPSPGSLLPPTEDLRG